MDELNPNHPVTSELHDHWHKLCALALHVMGRNNLTISSRDMESFAKKWTGKNGQVGAITVRPRGEVLLLQLVDGDEAVDLARKEGGLPV